MIFLAVVLLAAAAVAGVAQPRFGHAADTSSGGITVTGGGSVTTVPDRASFDLSVDARALTASGALTKVETAAVAVAAAVKDAGVGATDIQTSQVSLSPTTSDSGSITGYAASVTVTARTTLPKAGAVVDAAVGAGATGVSGPNLTRSDQSGLYRQALQKAVADATDKAKALAEAGSLTLGRVRTIVEGSSSTPIPFAQKSDASAGLPIEPGTQTIDATVTVTFDAS